MSFVFKMKVASAPIFREAKCGSYEGYCEGGHRELTNEVVAADMGSAWNEVIGRRVA
jgi:hypothetical protein